MRVTVIGAGIMGLSAAWALARSRHQVALHERGPVPNPHGSSADQHRLIRHPYGYRVEAPGSDLAHAVFDTETPLAGRISGVCSLVDQSTH